MVKVAISHTKEKHRSQKRVHDLVKEALDHLGGIAAFVKPGQTVLIKPNQTVYYSAEEGCTTDPLVVGALIRLAKQAGAARVQVAESSGGFFSSMQCMKITGMAAVAEREGADLIDLGSDETPNRIVKIPGGRIIHELGVTRMGTDPSKSVLNKNCQAHDVKNLFVADGGPFVSQADKNPTWTILALAMRTGEYIAEQRKAGSI